SGLGRLKSGLKTRGLVFYTSCGKTSRMLTKIYFAGLAISVALVGFFVFYAWSWLQSIGSPQAAADGYNYNAGVGWYVLCVSSVGLLILGNIIFIKTHKSWAMWTTLLYFVFFAIVDYFWLEPAASSEFGSQVLGRSTSLGTILAAIICIAATALIYA